MKKGYVVLRRRDGAFGAVASYGECRRNHAASTGGYVVDGCMEFMAGGDDGLKCTACGCHRSFHRKVVLYDQSPPVTPAILRRRQGGVISFFFFFFFFFD
ncbi:hypothetical protein HPP92_002114 [Vanilla planifolia]|uniref:ZF-HD dimerization-type domain-containing protein n=1 Tax=Vanilla planifolia TaxID=51239 RepID=A0A835VKA5_VANPL|nr:hypothetical protein HPP92_002114 [Vanilla planifolia]